MAIVKTINGKTPQWGKNCFIAENATLSGDCVLGDDCSVWTVPCCARMLMPFAAATA